LDLTGPFFLVLALIQNSRIFAAHYPDFTPTTDDMTLEERINNDLKEAMKRKDEVALRGVRAIKSAILLAKTDGSGQPIDAAREVQILQKLVKTRQESLDIYEKNNRPDLAEIEKAEIAVIRPYLPQMLEGEELENIIQQIINETGATSAKDMGRVMGVANKQLAGKAEGKTISEAVKKLLAN
jgi:uncharacterized protein